MTQTNNESALIEKLIIYEGFLIRQFLDAEEIAKPIKEKRRLFEDLVTEQEVLKQEMAENQAQTYISALKQFRSKFPEINRLEINVIGNIVDRRMPIGMRTLDYSAHPYIDGPNGLGSGMFRANSKDTIEIFGKAKSKGYILYFPSTHLLKARHGDKSMGWELREDERELMQKIWEEVK